MSALIEDYAIIGGTRTVALVSREGSVDWWCAPRIDSPACFAALLGDHKNGRWLLRPTGDVLATRRTVRPDALIVETEYDTALGTVAVIDFMVAEDDNPTIVRIVEGRSGSVTMQLELVVRFDYGSVVPWVRQTDERDGLTMVGGPDALRFVSPVMIEGQDHTTTSEFLVHAGDRREFSISWYSSLGAPPAPVDATTALEETVRWWNDWVARCTYDGPHRDDVVASLIVLKALTYSPTGAVVAAATTSLPEEIGGVRNWDYRYSWLRDTSFALQALMLTGYSEEALAWNAWLRRAVAGNPGDFQIMYDVYGRRRLTELTLDWLDGYEGSKPVRIGNGASGQFQLDVFGEVLDAALTAVKGGLIEPTEREHDIIPAVMDHLDNVWDQPDTGIWEIRGPKRHFTHSKVMAWVAYDRAIRLAEHLNVAERARVGSWRETRDMIHAQVCENGWNAKKNSFVQYYGADQLDASLLMLARVGFLPPEDPRIVGTVEAIERELLVDGFVRRYPTEEDLDGHPVDGLPGGEGAFFMCTFWYADNLALIGRRDEALAVFHRLCALRNDVGLLAEEYDPIAKRMLGNFPQAFSHLALINTAIMLGRD